MLIFRPFETRQGGPVCDEPIDRRHSICISAKIVFDHKWTFRQLIPLSDLFLQQRWLDVSVILYFIYLYFPLHLLFVSLFLFICNIYIFPWLVRFFDSVDLFDLWVCLICMHCLFRTLIPLHRFFSYLCQARLFVYLLYQFILFSFLTSLRVPLFSEFFYITCIVS